MPGLRAKLACCCDILIGDMLDNQESQLGNSGTITIEENLGFNNALELIRVVGTSQTARVATIDLGLSFNQDNMGDDGSVSNVIAIITWGQGAGGSFRAEVDVREGVQLSIAARRVEVAFYIQEPTGEPPAISEFMVSAAVTWGERAARSFPTFTTPITQLGVGGSTIIAVPDFAYSLFMYPLNSSFEVDVLGHQSLLDQNYGVIPAAMLTEGALTEGIKLPGGARFIQVRNTGGVAARFSAVFGLNL